MIRREKGDSSTFSILRSQIYNLKELNDKEEMDFMGLIENLKTHEIGQQVREDKDVFHQIESENLNWVKEKLQVKIKKKITRSLF